MSGYIETSLIECSRQSSEQALVGNESNTALWTNNLTNVYHLKAGDKVSVYSSFVSEKGAGNQDTIEIKGVSLRKTKSFTYTNDITEKTNIANGTFANGFTTNGIKGDFKNIIKQYYEEVTEEIELRDDTVNLIIDYTKNLDGNGYSQCPRRFVARRSTFPRTTGGAFDNSFAYTGDPSWLTVVGEAGSVADLPYAYPWGHADGTNTGRPQYGPTVRIPALYLKSDFRDTDDFLKLKQDNSKFTIFIRKNIILNENQTPPIELDNIEQPDGSFLNQYMTIAPESFEYVWYKEKKELKLQNGFISAQYVADDLTRQLREVTDEYNVQHTRTTTDKIYKTNISKIIETETYKTFFTSTEKFNQTDYNLVSNKTAFPADSKWYQNFNTVAIKRPEIWDAGRKISIMGKYTIGPNSEGVIVRNWDLLPENQYNNIMRGTITAFEYESQFNSPISLGIPYTKANLLLLRDFIQAQELYPEIFDSWAYDIGDIQSSVPYYDKTQTINNTRWFHINPRDSQPWNIGDTSFNYTTDPPDWNSDVRLIDVSGSDETARQEAYVKNFQRVFLGYGLWRSNVGNKETTDLQSQILLAHYNPDFRDTFFENPTRLQSDIPSDGVLKLSYGCFSKTTNGLISMFVDYKRDATATSPAYELKVPTEIKQVEAGHADRIEFGRKIGFDEHWSAFGTSAITLENGYGKGVNFYQTDRTVNSDPAKVINFPEYAVKRYLGAVNPEIGYDGEHFFWAGLHTDIKIGNNLLSGASIAEQQRATTPLGVLKFPFAPVYPNTSQIPMSNDVPAVETEPLSVVYKINPKEDYREFCIERCPYQYGAIYFTANGEKGGDSAGGEGNAVNSFGAQPPYIKTLFNPQLEPWTIYDSPTGIGIIDMGFTSDTWSESIWSTLGFSYQQFHSSTNNRLQRISPTNINNLKYITTNSLVLASDSSSWTVNDNSIPLIGENLAFNSLLYKYTYQGVADEADGGYATLEDIPEILQKTASIKITAENFPINMKRGYYTIRSDIVPNSSFVGGNPDNTNYPIVGIINKENPQSDFYFAQESGIEFVITRPTILSSINVSLHDPDGSFANTSNDSSIIFKIDKINNSSLDIVNQILNEKKK
mgnify:FL=1